jgi:hypothetical protein
VYAAAPGDARPLYLLAGRGLRYKSACNEQAPVDWSLHCEVDTLGRLVLVSSAGGRCLAESTWAIFSCFERNDVTDPFLDIWLLSCGYTPASTQVERWEDRCIPAALIPLTAAKWAAWLTWPLAAFARSQYSRFWDAPVQAWRQTGQHRQQVTGIAVQTDAWMAPQVGCTYISAKAGTDQYTFHISSAFQRADVGVPAWEVPIAITTIAHRA